MLVLRLLECAEAGTASGLVCAGRVGQPAEVAAASHRHHRESQIAEPDRSWLSGQGQLEVIYGHLAEVMLSQPATKIFLKTTEPNAAEWVSRAIGKVEIERMKETHFDGSRTGQELLA